MSDNQFVRRKNNRKLRNDDYDEALVGLLDGSDNEDGRHEEVALQPKRKSPMDFIEHQVQEGDTLSSLSLQFNCTVSQIKQLNNIHRDNEIFALRVVRIPITPFSVVTERITGGQNVSLGSDLCDDQDNTSLSKNHEPASSTVPQGVLVDTSLDQYQSDIDSSSDVSVCNPLLTPLPSHIILNSQSLSPEIDVVSTDIELPQNNTSNLLQCNGADCGMSWLTLFVCTLAIGFFGPLLFYIFLAKHHSEGTHHS